MRTAKINPKVISVFTGRRKLTDKTLDYPKSMFPDGQFDELIQKGFLIENVQDENSFATQNEGLVEGGEMLAEGELPEGSDLEKGEPVDFKDLQPAEDLEKETSKKGKKK